MLKRAERKGRKFQNPVPTSVGGLGIAFKVLPLYLTNREERVPKEPLGPFRTDAAVYRTPPRSGLRVTWMGHSSMLLEIDGVRVLLDPVWDERASPFSWMGPKRFFPAPLPLEELPALDVILISHDHYDHLGEQTVRRLARLDAARNARWVTSLDVGPILQRFGVRREAINELNWTDALPLRSDRTGGLLTVTALPARHFSGRSFGNRFETLWSSFALRGSAHNVYFGADSGYWAGFAEMNREHGPFDLTMLDTGAYNDLWKDIHMGPDGAIAAFQAMGAAGLLMPIHWALFDLSLHAWRWPIERISELADRENVPLWSPVPGVATEVERGVPLRTEWWRK